MVADAGTDGAARDERAVRRPAFGRASRVSRASTRGIRHELDVFVDVDDPVKFSLLTLTNDGEAARTLSLFAYNDWVLGPPRESQAGHIATTYDDDERDDPRAKCLQRRVRRSASRSRMPARCRVRRPATVSRSSAATVRWPGRPRCAT